MAAAWYRCTHGDWPPAGRLEDFARRLGPMEPLGSCAPSGSGVLFAVDGGGEACCFLQDALATNAAVLAVVPPTREPDKHLAWRLLHAGARDVLCWRESDPLIEAIRDRFARWAQVDEIVESPLVRDNLVGRSAAWRRILQEVVDLAIFSTISLLITGETGTGKELLARLVHTLDRRTEKGRLITLDCTAVVPELSGSEFFGHVRGAFTGAHSAREGAFALANRGTLFLDEVGDLALPLQAQLLRVTQEKTYKPVGGNEWQMTDFRLICATNRDLETDRDEGRFRADFFHRVAACRVHVTPLRERREDVLPLARHFLAQELGHDPGFDDTVAAFLEAQEYAGNVRELRQLVRRIAARHTGSGAVSAGAVPAVDRPAREGTSWRGPAFDGAIRTAVLQGVGLKEIGRAAEQVAERCAIEAECGNLQRAAARLGVSGRALQLRRAARRQGLTRP